MAALLVLAVILAAAALPFALRAASRLTLRAVGGCLVWAAVLSGGGVLYLALLSGGEGVCALFSGVAILFGSVAWLHDQVYGVTGPRPPREIPPHPWDRTN